jgi:hypothetical protein
VAWLIVPNAQKLGAQAPLLRGSTRYRGMMLCKSVTSEVPVATSKQLK